MQKQFVPKARICKKKGRRKKNYSKKVKKEKYSDTVSHSYVRPFLRSFSKAKKYSWENTINIFEEYSKK